MPASSQPNFLIIGVQKAGTTFLAQKLSEHPAVFFCRPKEPFFFSHKKVTPDDFALYKHEYFYKSSTFERIGEGSTNYFSNKHAIGNIEKYLGTDIKIILCLRHPLERALSHFLHDYKRGRLPGSISTRDEKFKSYLARSLYAERLKIWQRKFGDMQVQIFDDLVHSGADFYRQGESFLGLTPAPVEDSIVNEGLRLAWRGDALTLTGPATGGVAPAFERADVERMQALFLDDIAETEQLLGRDLSAWKRLPDFSVLDEKFAEVRSTV